MNFISTFDQVFLINTVMNIAFSLFVFIAGGTSIVKLARFYNECNRIERRAFIFAVCIAALCVVSVSVVSISVSAEGTTTALYWYTIIGGLFHGLTFSKLKGDFLRA